MCEWGAQGGDIWDIHLTDGKSGIPMDARQRLNQLRRLPTKRNRNAGPVGRPVSDLRQMITRKPIGGNRFGSNNTNNKTGRRLAITATGITTARQRQPQRLQTQKRVSLDNDQRMPIVSVNLSQIRDNSRLKLTPKPFVKDVIREKHKRTRNEPKRQRQTIVSSTQPIIIPQMVQMLPQTSTAAYGMPSSSAVTPKPYLTDDSKSTVLVSNLNPTITLDDMKELFGEIGQLVRITRVNSSMVFIVFEDPINAKTACQTYHNRLLDGLPMSCNILSNSVNEFELDSHPTPRTTHYRRDDSGLLASDS
ncbi:unnamed protein product [Oppiella nova]|uniref:RRM domain-containing protein n=1 Tax=Oppiella nova TaxID=334625 RepID=A0A7R9LE57_9ACAR|nr:unnamed protein product [Oppiella nova]CAG2162036.1 unnamed protein product [Oppiella nova]